MAESIYSKISKVVGKDVRQVRTVAHHPFEFLSTVIADPYDHRPVRLRYLGAFIVKPYWRKELKNTKKVGFPTDGMEIWARVPETYGTKTRTRLRQGKVVGDEFIPFEGSFKCFVKDLKFWGGLS